MHMDEIIKLLKANSLRVTKSRIAVASILVENSGQLLTPEEIFQKVETSESHACDQASVYRILNKFEELDIVTKSIFKGDAARYMIDECGNDHSHHHHFFKCDSCGKIEAFDECFFSPKEKEMTASGYTNLSHHLEITGTCPSCSNEK